MRDIQESMQQESVSNYMILFWLTITGLLETLLMLWRVVMRTVNTWLTQTTKLTCDHEVDNGRYVHTLAPHPHPLPSHTHTGACAVVLCGLTRDNCLVPQLAIALETTA